MSSVLMPDLEKQDAYGQKDSFSDAMNPYGIIAGFRFS